MGKRVGPLSVIGVATVCCLCLFGLSQSVSATAGVNQEISFEGKIVTAAGLNIPDGTYNMEFKLYTAAGTCNPTTGAGCTLGWTEDWLVSAGKGVTFTSGTYQVNLDAVAANNFSGIDFNSYPLYLSLQIGSTSSCAPAGNFTANCGGDGEMKPYVLLTSTPYALNSNLLDGLDSTAFGQLASGQTFTGANVFQPTTNITGLVVKQTSFATPTANIFNVQTANGTNVIQVTGPSANNAAVAIASVGPQALTLTSGAALNFTGAAASTWDIGANTLSLQTTNNGAITTGTGLLTVGGNLTFSGTTARTITGPGTGGLTVTSGGGLVLTGSATSTWQIGGTNQNLTIQTSGTGTLALDTTGAGVIALGDGSATTLNIAANNVAHTFHIGDGGTSTAQAITIGSTGSSSGLTLQSGTGNINLSPVAGSDVVYSEGVGSNMQLTATAAPTVDQLAISNVGQGVTTAGVNGLSVNYVGGNAAIESSGLRIDFAPGGTSGGVWSGLRIVANATGPASGVTSYGMKIEGPTTPGAGTEEGIKITTGFDIGLDIASGGIQLADMGNPSTPTSGNLKVYAKLVDGRSMLKVVGPSGVDYPLQPSLFQNQVTLINVGSGTTLNSFGTGATTSGTGVTAAFSETYGYMGGFTTGNSSGGVGGVGNATASFARGSVSNGANGFFANIRGSVQDASYPSTRILVGMTDQTVAACITNQNQGGNRAAFSYDTGRGDTNWMFSTRDGTTENLVNTGMPFSAAAAYDWYIYTPPYPNNTTIYWRIDNLTAGTSFEGSVTANLPTGSAAMRMAIAVRNLTTGAHTISFQRIYVESDR